MISKITDNLFIGEYSDVIGSTSKETKTRLNQLEASGIRYVLSLCNNGMERSLVNKELKVFNRKEKNKSHISLYLNPIPSSAERAGLHDVFEVGFALATKTLNNIFFNDPGAKILVHCLAGIDRAPFLVASYIAHNRHSDIATIYGEIKKIRPSVIEHPEWIGWQSKEKTIKEE
jgi:hypothetical protein